MTTRTAAPYAPYSKRKRHPFATPPELRGESQQHPVVIVGAGPVGLTAAACLARFGIASVVLERNTAAGEGSRAICLSRRSLEILDWTGASGPFVAHGLGWTRGRAFYRDRLIHELSMPHSADEKFFPMTNLQQYRMEEFLAEHCAGQPLVQVRWGSELAALDCQPERLLAGVRTAAGSYELPCSYLIATDGARSAVRRLLGLSFTGSSFAGRYLIADIRLRSAAPAERRAWFDPPSNPGSTVLMHKQPEDVWRIDYQLLESDDERSELAPQRVRSRVQRHLDFIGEHGEWELLWKSIYSAHSLALADYVQGRVIFAGDAAHLVPIFGVRGLNSGIADAHNLAWKLAWVLRGDADESLLRTYSTERRSATLAIHRQADKSTRFMTPASRGDILMRSAVLSLAVDHEFTRALVNPRQSVPDEYGSSPLNTLAATDSPPGSPQPAEGPAPGAPLRNFRVRRGTREGYLSDWIGTEFLALLFVHCDAVQEQARLMADLEAVPGLRLLSIAPEPAIDDPSRRWIHLEDPAEAAPRLYAARETSCYLVRPDGHVCARWKRAVAADIIAALRTAQSRPNP